MDVDRTVSDADGKSESSTAKNRGPAAARKRASAAVQDSHGKSAKVVKANKAPAPEARDADEDEENFDLARARNAGKIAKSLDATQLYLNEIGYFPATERRRGKALLAPRA